MKIELWTIEKAGKSEYAESIADYAKRINRYSSFELRELDNSKIISKNTSMEEVKKREAELIHKLLQDNDYLVLLDERGKSLRSVQLSEQINQWQLANKQRVILLIAGAFGPSDDIRQRANYTLSLSPLTLPHRLAKLLMTEQIYRAFSILNGEKYHHD